MEKVHIRRVFGQEHLTAQAPQHDKSHHTTWERAGEAAPEFWRQSGQTVHPCSVTSAGISPRILGSIRSLMIWASMLLRMTTLPERIHSSISRL